MTEPERQVREIVDRETRAWDAQDTELLLSVFHPDMVWAWPPTADSHDPQLWVWGMGRFDAERWRTSWEELFATHELIHNRRRTVRISISPEQDGAFAVVDVDTLWRHRSDSTAQHRTGRACKLYTQLAGEWKLIAHTGLLHHA
jgi:ketosteroid isomerase-like protein